MTNGMILLQQETFGRQRDTNFPTRRAEEPFLLTFIKVYDENKRSKVYMKWTPLSGPCMCVRVCAT